MKEIIKKEDSVKDLIYEARGKQVMLDSDLAMLYGCKNGTKEINQAVKNNPNKFPERYTWKLTDEELTNLRSKILTTNYSSMSRSNPRVFTEQGVAMLATILKTKVATEASIKIMDTFVSMRHYLIENKDIYKSINNINNKLIEHDEKIEEIFSKFDKDEEYLYLPGQVYDAYSKVLDIFKLAKKELIIIDSYADKNLLDIIKDLKVKVIIITKRDNLLKELDIEKYNKQYRNLKVIYNNTFHDRYFIIDRIEIYHCGASINRIGYKTFSINKIEDEIIKETIVNNVYTIIK